MENDDSRKVALINNSDFSNSHVQRNTEYDFNRMSSAVERNRSGGLPRVVEESSSH